MQEMRERKVKVAHHRSGLMLWAWVFVLGVIVIRGDSRSLRPPRPKMFRACGEYLFTVYCFYVVELSPPSCLRLFKNYHRRDPQFTGGLKAACRG